LQLLIQLEKTEFQIRYCWLISLTLSYYSHCL